ncbi:hypothetical protein C8F01DRAFT_1090993 [Mycena amicta]|nr:hypothetical protein C8F01DRAFT_1090993 [Mycena amicta]
MHPARRQPYTSAVSVNEATDIDQTDGRGLSQERRWNAAARAVGSILSVTVLIRPVKNGIRAGPSPVACPDTKMNQSGLKPLSGTQTLNGTRALIGDTFPPLLVSRNTCCLQSGPSGQASSPQPGQARQWAARAWQWAGPRLKEALGWGLSVGKPDQAGALPSFVSGSDAISITCLDLNTTFGLALPASDPLLAKPADLNGSYTHDMPPKARADSGQGPGCRVSGDSDTE